MQNSGSPDQALAPVLRNTNDDVLRSPYNEKANQVLVAKRHLLFPIWNTSPYHFNMFFFPHYFHNCLCYSHFVTNYVILYF